MSKRRSCKHNIKDVEYILCPYCENSKKFKMIHWSHLKKVHNKTLEDVLKDFPNIPTMTKQESDRRSRARIKCDKKITKTCNEKYGGVGYQSEELEEKTRNTVQKKYGAKNVMQSKKVSSKFKGDKNPMKNPETAKKVSKTKKIFYKTHNHHHKGKTYNEIMGPERAAERIKELRISGALGQSLTPFISAPQLELYTLVKQVYPDAKIEYPIDIFCIDIAIEDLKIAIEYDGSYWHDKERDIYRDSVLKEKGWSTIRFKDYVPSKEELILEINKNII